MCQGVIEITDESFRREVLEHAGCVVVDFWATDCGPCSMLEPVLDELSNELSERVKIVKLNALEHEEMAIEHGVNAAPTLIAFKSGKETARTVGALPKEQLRVWFETFA